jgi:hypothetical protein
VTQSHTEQRPTVEHFTLRGIARRWDPEYDASVSRRAHPCAIGRRANPSYKAGRKEPIEDGRLWDVGRGPIKELRSVGSQ